MELKLLIGIVIFSIIIGWLTVYGIYVSCSIMKFCETMNHGYIDLLKEHIKIRNKFGEFNTKFMEQAYYLKLLCDLNHIEKNGSFITPGKEQNHEVLADEDYERIMEERGYVLVDECMMVKNKLNLKPLTKEQVDYYSSRVGVSDPIPNIIKKEENEYVKDKVQKEGT